MRRSRSAAWPASRFLSESSRAQESSNPVLARLRTSFCWASLILFFFFSWGRSEPKTETDTVLNSNTGVCVVQFLVAMVTDCLPQVAHVRRSAAASLPPSVQEASLYIKGCKRDYFNSQQERRRMGLLCVSFYFFTRSRAEPSRAGLHLRQSRADPLTTTAKGSNLNVTS